MMKDKELLAMLKDPKTQREGFAVMVSQYSESLYWKVRHIVIDHDDADDVLQNTFMKAWLALDDFRGDCQISTWLYRIALNESLSLLQRTHTDERLSDEVNEGCARSLEGDAYFDGDELELKLQKAIASLPDKQRIVFNLRYFDEMKYSEMSSLLSTSEGALKASYHLAVKKIEQYFVEND